MSKNKSKTRGNLDKQSFSIIRGADQNRLPEIQGALAEDPECINKRDDRIGVTALHIAAGDGNKALVQFLIEQPGCEFDPEDNLGRTPAMLAYVIGRDDIVRLISSAIAKDLGNRFPEDESSATNAQPATVLPFSRPPRPKDP